MKVEHQKADVTMARAIQSLTRGALKQTLVLIWILVHYHCVHVLAAASTNELYYFS
jgi:hypothetical protein